MSDILSDRDINLIKKYLIGGAAVGGGVALGTSLLNYLRHINKNKSQLDDDTLYVTAKKPEEDEQEKSASIGGGLALAGGAVAGIGSYALMKKLYTKGRMSEAQGELDKAQRQMLEVQGFKPSKRPSKKKEESNKDEPKKEDTEQEKEASAAPTGQPMSVSEHVLSAGTALPLLLALGGGVVSYQMLDKANPINKSKPKKPRRVEIIQEEEEEQEKQASVFRDEEADKMEFLIRMTLLTKQADCITRAIVNTTAAGMLPDFKKSAYVNGLKTALNLVEDMQHVRPSPLAEHMAIATLAKSASVRENLGALVAAEFAEAQGGMFNIACNLDAADAYCLEKIAGILGHCIRSERSEELGVGYPKLDSMEKIAASEGDIMELAMQALAEREAKQDLNNDGVIGNPDGEEENVEDPDTIKMNGSKKNLATIDGKIDEDVIDKILSPS